jgi:quinol monooxygenase YgiN
MASRLLMTGDGPTGSMIIAILDMTLPRGHEAETARALRAFWDSTIALPGCIGGGVFQEVGCPEAALYVEMWQEEAQLEAHIRSRDYERLLAVMETSAEPPALRFEFVVETRGLAWVEQLRLGT